MFSSKPNTSQRRDVAACSTGLSGKPLPEAEHASVSLWEEITSNYSMKWQLVFESAPQRMYQLL